MAIYIQKSGVAGIIIINVIGGNFLVVVRFGRSRSERKSKHQANKSNKLLWNGCEETVFNSKAWPEYVERVELTVFG